MKKLQKLNEKKIESMETIKGGKAMLAEFSVDAGDSTVTTHTATQRGDQYFCDHSTDPK